jgi:purine nucleoside phosphorylase
VSTRLGVIGGTGTASWVADARPVRATDTPFGAASAPVLSARLGGQEVLLLTRHGVPGGARILPHAVNYRANVWALRAAGATALIGVNAVGGIAPAAAPGVLVIPDQLIDYTWGRAQTFAGALDLPEVHVEFTGPFDPRLRELMLAAGVSGAVPLVPDGVYGVTQGPRLETAAEIERLARDGCTVVGMTAMPEAALARELGLPYALCCLVVNRAAGRAPAGQSLHAEIAASLATTQARAAQLLGAMFRN